MNQVDLFSLCLLLVHQDPEIPLVRLSLEVPRDHLHHQNLGNLGPLEPQGLPKKKFLVFF